MNSSPLNPDAPVFVPGGVAGSDLLLAESPRKPLPMDDIELPDVTQFQTEANIRPAELHDLDNCDQLNGHHNLSMEGVTEHLNGNSKNSMDSLGFGFSVGIEQDKIKDTSLLQDFERIQKDTTDFCNLQVFQAHETNPFNTEGDDELFERLKNKERDPMSMSFYQEKDDDTCERFNKSDQHVDLNAVQLLPESDDEDIPSNGVYENVRDDDKENLNPEHRESDLLCMNNVEDPNIDTNCLLDNADMAVSNFVDFDVNSSSNIQNYSNTEFETDNRAQDTVAPTDTPESHKLLFEQIPEIPDGKSSELGFTNEDILEPLESEKDVRAMTPQDETSQDIEMDSKVDDSPSEDVHHEIASNKDEPNLEEIEHLESSEPFEDNQTGENLELLCEKGTNLEKMTLESSEIDQHLDIISPEVNHENIVVDVHNSDLQNDEKLESDLLSESPLLTDSQVHAESPILQESIPSESSIPQDSHTTHNILSTHGSILPQESSLPQSPLQRASPLPQESLLPHDSPLPLESPLPHESLLPNESPLPCESPLAREASPAHISPLPHESHENNLCRDSPLPYESPLPHVSPVPSQIPQEVLEPTESPVPNELHPCESSSPHPSQLPVESLHQGATLPSESPLPTEFDLPQSLADPLETETLINESSIKEYIIEPTPIPAEIPLPRESPIPSDFTLPEETNVCIQNDELLQDKDERSASVLSGNVEQAEETLGIVDNNIENETVVTHNLVSEVESLTMDTTQNLVPKTEQMSVEVSKESPIEFVSSAPLSQSPVQDGITSQPVELVASPIPCEQSAQPVENGELKSQELITEGGAPTPDIVPERSRTELVTDIDIGIPESHAQEICVPVTSEIQQEDALQPGATPPPTPAVEPAQESQAVGDAPIAAPIAAAAAGVAALAVVGASVAKTKSSSPKKSPTATSKTATPKVAPKVGTTLSKTPASAAKRSASSTTPRSPAAPSPRTATTRTSASATKTTTPSKPLSKSTASSAPPKPIASPTMAAKPAPRVVAAAPSRNAASTRPAAPRPAAPRAAPKAPAPKPTAPAAPKTSAPLTKLAAPAARAAPRPAPARVPLSSAAPAKPKELKPKPTETKKPLTNGDVKLSAKPASAPARAPAARPAPRPAPRAPGAAPPTTKPAAPKAPARAPLDKQSKDLANKRITAKAAPPRTVTAKAPTSAKAVPKAGARAAKGALNGDAPHKPPPSPPPADNALLPDVIA